MDLLDLWGVGLIAMYAVLTYVGPRVLSRPRLLFRFPQLALTLWTGALIIATVSLTLALGLLISQALSHHVEHQTGHSADSALIDSLMGWLAVAVLGVLAFRIGAAGAEQRSSARTAIADITRSLGRADILMTPEATVWMVESSVPIVAVVPAPHRVFVTTAVRDALDEEAFRAVVAHEAAHIRLHHIGLRTLTRLAEATAAGFRASRDYAQVVRIGTELIADDWAADRVGRFAVARALRALYPEVSGVAERITRLESR